MDYLKVILRLKEAGVTNPGRLVMLILQSNKLSISFSTDKWELCFFFLCPKHDNTRKKSILINSNFWNQLFLEQKLPYGLGEEEKWAGLAAKFGSICQMAGEMAWYYSVWSTMVQFSLFSGVTIFYMLSFWYYYCIYSMYCMRSVCIYSMHIF